MMRLWGLICMYEVSCDLRILASTVLFIFLYTPVKSYVVKWPQEKRVTLINRAQPDITSGPEVRQIFKCPDSKKNFFFCFFMIFFVYLYGKIFEIISPDSVRSGRTCPANLGVRSCPVRKLICPVRSSPMLLKGLSSLCRTRPDVNTP